jgi:hypothetical protein
MMSHHQLYLGVNWAAPILLFCFSSIFLMVLQKIFSEQLQRWGFALQEKDIEVDEDLPNFFKSIKLSQANEVCAEENNMKENYGFSYNDGDTIDCLEDSKIPKKAIQGTPWYQALSNPKYSFLFNYCGVFVGERHKLIEDGAPDEEGPDGDLPKSQQMVRAEQSDMVMLLLNLAYVPDTVIGQLDSFKAGWQVRFQGLMDAEKEAFEKDTGKKWRFQDEELEKEYHAFYINVREVNQTVKNDRAEDGERVRQEKEALEIEGKAM